MKHLKLTLGECVVISIQSYGKGKYNNDYQKVKKSGRSRDLTSEEPTASQQKSDGNPSVTHSILSQGYSPDGVTVVVRTSDEIAKFAVRFVLGLIANLVAYLFDQKLGIYALGITTGAILCWLEVNRHPRNVQVLREVQQKR